MNTLNPETTFVSFNIEIKTTQNTEILASRYKGIDIPEGEVIPGDKNVNISEQVLADYDAFIESLEDLLIDYYGLELTYLNFSEDYSNYYNFLAKDAEGKLKLKFRLRLRVSNHKAHRTKASQRSKKQEENSEELQKFSHGRSLIPYSHQIIVNNKTYTSYTDAFIDIDEQIQHWVSVMLGN